MKSNHKKCPKLISNAIFQQLMQLFFPNLSHSRIRLKPSLEKISNRMILIWTYRFSSKPKRLVFCFGQSRRWLIVSLVFITWSLDVMQQTATSMGGENKSSNKKPSRQNSCCAYKRWNEHVIPAFRDIYSIDSFNVQTNPTEVERARWPKPNCNNMMYEFIYILIRNGK